jgi:hypothetical protein
VHGPCQDWKKEKKPFWNTHCYVAGILAMVGQAHQYRTGAQNVDGFDENIPDHPEASYNLRRSAETELPENSVPLFLSDPSGEPDPGEYIAPLLRERKASISARILTGVCAAAAAAILVAMFSSDAARDIIVDVRTSMAAVIPAPSVAAQSNPSELAAFSRPADSARPSASENQPQSLNLATPAAEPGREEIKMAKAAAPQGRVPTNDSVAEPTMSADAIHHLEPDVIAALLRRADALIASGDVAAARLVLRRAANAGDAAAAMMLAGTYDPANLAKLGVHGIVPDVAMAQSWYEKAKQFGSAEAPQRLEMLASKRR